jgi:hypothetical protein
MAHRKGKILNWQSRFVLGFLFFGLGAIPTWAQKITPQKYIETYSELAIKEMIRTGIPASITMAQGMLESGNGNSKLAVKANNHFGIKCHKWTGPKIYHDDDKRNECFRKYKSAYESYIDHSDFLTRTPRYNFLFELKPTDYKGWCRGLKKAGYATARNYDDLLIAIIERYGLQELDKQNKIAVKHQPGSGQIASTSEHKIKTRNNIKYTVAKPGDTYKKLTDEFDLMRWQIAKYNEISQGTDIETGDIIYLQPKRNKAAAGNRKHMVKEGETLYDISQQYGVKLKSLYKKNLMREGEEPEPGDVIHLRRKKQGKMPEIIKDTEDETGSEEDIRFEFE